VGLKYYLENVVAMNVVWAEALLECLTIWGTIASMVSQNGDMKLMKKVAQENK
tara:strand:+ start:1351 stop:1509 length:159 start_codon:yes stop_codon:yes gene_type:complete